MRDQTPNALVAEWLVAATEAGAARHPDDLRRIPLAAPWRQWSTGQPLLEVMGPDKEGPGSTGHSEPDAFDWWFRTSFLVPEGGAWLEFGGLATLATVWLDGQQVLTSANMFLRHVVPVPHGSAGEIAICCRALSSAAPTGSRARWRAALVSHPALRWIRTTFIGRMNDGLPATPPIGPWRPVRVFGGDQACLSRSRIRLRDRSLYVDAELNGDGRVGVSIVVGEDRFDIGDYDLPASVTRELALPSIGHWAPSTNGDRELLDVALEVEHPGRGRLAIRLGQVASRSVAFDWERAAVIRINGAPVFCRGAVWNSDARPADAEALRSELECLARLGFNMLRIDGTSVYEEPAFYDICDDLGIMVWQDVMRARIDYPSTDERWLSAFRQEMEQLADLLSGHPCVVVVCGGSEIEQQASMLGLPSEICVDRFARDELRRWMADLLPGVAYLPNSPVGGTFPFSPSVGVSHYFGVGAYRRPLDDARRSGVRFASECLAFSAIPEDQTLEGMVGSGDPAQTAIWKEAVPRDPRSSWDFEDVRDHYVRELFGDQLERIRLEEPARYLDLGRAALSHVFESVLAEWRRPQSSCNGALVLRMKDPIRGAGFGLVDCDGRPKSSMYGLARAASPRTVLLADEGLNGLECHIINDLDRVLEGSVRIRAFDAESRLVADNEVGVTVGPASSESFFVDGLMRGFRDVTYAYRFGPRHVDLVVAELIDREGHSVSTRHFLSGGPDRERRDDLNLSLVAESLSSGDVVLTVSAERVATFVCLSSGPLIPADCWFHLAPGEVRRIRCTYGTRAKTQAWSGIASARAINGTSRATVQVST